MERDARSKDEQAQGDDVYTIRESAAVTNRCAEELRGAGVTTAESAAWREIQAGTLEPLVRERLDVHPQIRAVLSKTLQSKWAEASQGPPRDLREVLEGSDATFKAKLLLAQGECKELKPIVDAAYAILRASGKSKIAEAEALAKDYRLNPKDGVLERSVHITGAQIWYQLCLLRASLLNASSKSRRG